MRGRNKDVVRGAKYISLLCLVGFNVSAWADVALESAQPNVLSIQPNTCVSLHQGQACFANLTMSWRTANSANYCLYSSAQTVALKCWVASKQGVITQEFNTEQSLRFYLKEENSTKVLAESELKVSWVYKKQQKSRLTWRLF